MPAGKRPPAALSAVAPAPELSLSAGASLAARGRRQKNRSPCSPTSCRPGSGAIAFCRGRFGGEGTPAGKRPPAALPAVAPASELSLSAGAGLAVKGRRQKNRSPCRPTSCRPGPGAIAFSWGRFGGEGTPAGKRLRPANYNSGDSAPVRRGMLWAGK